MAAGIGSRFGGGIKQLTPIDDNGHIIMDYSIHDAIEAGFNKIVFIIRKDIEKDFKEVIGDRITAVCKKKGVETAYCFQEIDALPKGYSVPEGRTKPWGTGHAVLCAKDCIDGAFAVLNADDYYGKEAFKKMHDWLAEEHHLCDACMIGFVLKNTLSENGGVTRAICKLYDDEKYLKRIVETKNIKASDGNVIAENEGRRIELDPESLVSMNMWGFPECTNELLLKLFDEKGMPIFIDSLEEDFLEFLKKDMSQDPLKSEFLLPDEIGKLIAEDYPLNVEVLPSNDKWFGVTYAADKDSVMNSFRKMLADGIYPEAF